MFNLRTPPQGREHFVCECERGHLICTVSLWEKIHFHLPTMAAAVTTTAPETTLCKARSILWRVEATSKCKISRALRDKTRSPERRSKRTEPGELGVETQPQYSASLLAVMTRRAPTTLKITHRDLIRAWAAGKRFPLPN